MPRRGGRGRSRKENAPSSNESRSNNAPQLPPYEPRYEPFAIRFSLDDRDFQTLNALGIREIARRLRVAGAPLKELRSATVSERVLCLYGSNPRLELDLRLRAADICECLDLQKATIVPEKYYVKTVGMRLDKKEFKEPNDFLEEWRQDNDNIRIESAFWARTKLILVLHKLEDALALCRRTIFISGRHGRVEPYEIRSRPMFCWNCGLIGHMKDQCPDKGKRVVCLKCGAVDDHSLWQCRKKAKYCIRCDTVDHETISPQCQNREVLSMFGDCAYYDEVGPRWAAALTHDFYRPSLPENTPLNESVTSPSTTVSSKRSTPSQEDASTPSTGHVATRMGPIDFMGVHRRETLLERTPCPPQSNQSQTPIIITSPPETQQSTEPVRKKRGRPRKDASPAASLNTTSSATMSSFKFPARKTSRRFGEDDDDEDVDMDGVL